MIDILSSDAFQRKWGKSIFSVESGHCSHILTNPLNGKKWSVIFFLESSQRSVCHFVISSSVFKRHFTGLNFLIVWRSFANKHVWIFFFFLQFIYGDIHESFLNFLVVCLLQIRIFPRSIRCFFLITADIDWEINKKK